MKKKNFWFVISIAVILIIAFLTFQDKNNTESLSNSIRDWLYSIGINISGKQLRSNAHIVEYCLLGIALSEYGTISNKNFGWIITVGFCLGLIDETIRFLIPTREFEFIDLMKDWAGVFIGAIIVFFIKSIKQGKDYKNDQKND